MSLFPGATATVYRNEAGEPIGWDNPSDDASSFYCDDCGSTHSDAFDCFDYGDDDVEDEDDELGFRECNCSNPYCQA